MISFFLITLFAGNNYKEVVLEEVVIEEDYSGLTGPTFADNPTGLEEDANSGGFGVHPLTPHEYNGQNPAVSNEPMKLYARTYFTLEKLNLADKFH